MSPPKITKPQMPPVAVIGIDCMFPGSHDKQGFWRDITAGRNMIRPVPPSHFLIEHYYDPDPLVPDKTYCKQGAFLDPIEFDPMEFGIPPTNLVATDTSQLLSLVVAKQVLKDAFKKKFETMDRSRISVILGVAAGLELLGEMATRLTRPTWVQGMREAGLPENEINDICDRIMATRAPWKESTFPGLLGNVVAGRIANYFDLGGLNCTTDAACASSFSALYQGLRELAAKTSDVVIVGGADTTNDAFLFVSFSKTPALSPSHDCRPFSDQADGMVIGEGIGMLAIKRLEDAERDGDRIYAVIRGIGASSDGKGSSIYAPLAKGQAAALRRCYEAAAYSPQTVELLEAHGTATRPGDKTEFQALKQVFGNGAGHELKKTQWCALGSIKSQIGHTKGAAAAAGIIKAIMGLHHKVLPPTIKVERPNPRLEIEKSPFYLNTLSRPWVRDNAHPRRASISSFGFGGTNFHVTVEEYKGQGKSAWRIRNVPSELIVLCASNAKTLDKKCRDISSKLNAAGMLTYLAKTSQADFDPSAPAKLTLVATSENDLRTKLNHVIKKLSEKPEQKFSLPGGINCTLKKTPPGGIAFLFPGQGASVYIGMGADLAMHFTDAMDVWDLSATCDRNRGAKEFLHNVVFPLPVFSEKEKITQVNKLSLTQWSQPGILTTCLAMSQLLKGLGITPDCVGGHSLGEISALYDAGILDMESLFDICSKRGELMAETAPTSGTMTAVFSDADKIQAILNQSKTQIIIANYNSPGQVVLSGSIADMEKIEHVLVENNLKIKRLPVSAAFHSPMMNKVRNPFLDYLKKFDFKKPQIPVYSNVSGKTHQKRPAAIREALARQIDHPVCFTKEIASMYTAGIRTFIEVGPNNVLTGFVDKILADKPHFAIPMDTKNEHGVTSFLKGLGRLVIAGLSPDFSYLWKDNGPISDPAKKKKPKMTVTLTGANYGKPYPPPGGIKDYPKPNPPRPEATDNEPHQLKTKSIETSAFPNGFMQKNVDSLITAYQHIQEQTSKAHETYLNVIAKNHSSFLKAAESSNNAISSLRAEAPLVPVKDKPTPEFNAAESPPSPPVKSSCFKNETATHSRAQKSNQLHPLLSTPPTKAMK